MFLGRVFLAGTMACLMAAAVQAVPILVDFQSSTGTTAAGYIAVTSANRWDNSTTVDLGDGVRGGWLDAFGTGVGSFNRTGYTGDLTRDGVSWNSSAAAETFKLAGLQAGSYDLKIYSSDPQYRDKQTTFAVDGDNDGAAELNFTIWNNVGAEYEKTVAVTVSTAGILQITIDGLGGATGAINGLDLVAVPEPATLLMVLAGLGLSRVRRR